MLASSARAIGIRGAEIGVYGAEEEEIVTSLNQNEIRANSVLPAHREPIVLTTADGLRLVGELATPVDTAPVATLVCVHPLPTQGGMMDSHLFRKAAWRLPALAGFAVLRFNTRGTSSPAGQSEGEFDQGEAEGLDLAAAVDFVHERGLPTPWLVGWSFGTDVILKSPPAASIAGVILISPPLHFSSEAELLRWASLDVPIIALVPELDDYLRPAQARERFGVLPNATVIEGVKAKHLWVGESSVVFVLNQIAHAVDPQRFISGQNDLSTTWQGPMERWTDL